MDLLIIFGSTFLAVFALGLQSLNVNQGHYIAAATTSTLISTGHIYLYELMPQATLGTRLGYYLGGIAGITASMWFHRRIKVWWQARGPRGFRPAHMKKGGINDGPFTPKPPAPPGQTPPRSTSDEHRDVAICGGGYQPAADLNSTPPRSGSGLLLRDDTH